MRKTWLMWLALAALGCGSAPNGLDEAVSAGGVSLTGNGAGARLDLANVSEVNVVVLGVDLLVASPAGRHLVTVPMRPRVANLMAFRPFAEAVLSGAAAGGKITQIRLAMDGTVVVVFPDRSYRVARVPSGTTSGIKILTNGLDPTDLGRIQLAFDPRRQLHETGAGELIMRPVIKLGSWSGLPALDPAGHPRGHGPGPGSTSAPDGGTVGGSNGGSGGGSDGGTSGGSSGGSGGTSGSGTGSGSGDGGTWVVTPPPR